MAANLFGIVVSFIKVFAHEKDNLHHLCPVLGFGATIPEHYG